MDMSLPRDSNGWGDGSPLTEISRDDSVSYTLARSGTPPRGKFYLQYSPEQMYPRIRTSVDGDQLGLSASPTPNASIPMSMKRKRSALAFDGVAPPGRKRKVRIFIRSASAYWPETFHRRVPGLPSRLGVPHHLHL